MRLFSLSTLSIVLLASQAAWTRDIQVSGLETLFLPEKIVREAFTFIGTPYEYGGGTEAGVDCSGLVSAVFRKAAGTELARTTEDLFVSGKPAGTPLRVGDLIFFDTDNDQTIDMSKRSPSHVGIFIGNGGFIHAASKGGRTGVIISSLSEKYYAGRFLGARRMIQWNPPALDLTLDESRKSYTLKTPLPARIPLDIRVKAGKALNGVALTAVRDGREVFTRRLIPSKSGVSTVPFVTQQGLWTLLVRSRDGTRTLTVDFRVGE